METQITDAPEIEEGIVLAEWGGRDDRTIHERMVAILAELPALGKDAYNEQQRFHYRAHDDVLNALNPLLAKHGVYVTPKVRERIADRRTTSSGKAMYEVNLHVEFTFHGEDGTSVSATAWGEGTDMGDKATNKAMTAAFKYALFQTFAISTEEASDADAEAPEETMAQAEQHQREEEKRAPRKPREFDPGRDLLPGAITVRTEEDATMLRQAQRDLDPTQDWVAIEDTLCELVFGQTYAHFKTSKPKREFWTRLANAVVRVQDLAGVGDFPPPTLEQIAEGYAFAFEGHAPPLKATGADLPPSEDSPEAGATPDEAKPEEAADGEAEAQPDAT